MSKKLLLLAILIGYSFFGYTQMIGLPRFVNDTLQPDFQPFAKLQIDGFYNTTALSSKMLNQIVAGSYITNDTRLKAYNNIRDFNYLMGDASLRLAYGNRVPSSTNQYYIVEAYQRANAYGVIAGDLLGFAYFGNSPFLGSNLEFSNTKYTNFYSWATTIQVGATKPKSNWRVGMGLHILFNLTQIELNNSRLSSNSYGTELYAELHAKLTQSLTNTLTGVSILGAYSFSGGPKGNAYTLDFSVENLGIAYGIIQQTTIDTALLYKGVNAFNSLNFTVLSDSLLNGFQQSTDTTEQVKIIPLPAQLTVKYTKQFNEKYNANLAVAMNYWGQFVIGGEAGLSYQITPKHMASMGYFIGMNGANNLNAYYRFTGNKWEVGSFVYSIESLLGPEGSTGLGFGVQVLRLLN